ncbi:helix-turn-helix transcriptional regulator [Plantactinospora sp. S1510]|uniref:Helix-turn-helix transcriptional regulator n=2 Tax=Plantactinospora alkalitolerans TaxID=2789879 RepID=A0ABS0H9X1_9ACTN|nr:helix-turn-helix transcriptional regulator [Plantactinospora alkalitolerans]
MSLEQAGRLCGYSGSTMSRFETGRRKLTDVNVLHRLADALGIPPGMLGLTSVNNRPATTAAVRVPEGRSIDGGDMDRRNLLAGVLVTLATPPAVGGPSAARAAAVLPVSLDRLRAELAAGRADFAAARYEQLARRLPGLVQAAEATWDATAHDRRAGAGAFVALSHDLGARLMIKMHHTEGAAACSVRASQAARVCGEPAIVALVDRTVTVVMRRTGQARQAQPVLLDAATRLRADTGLASGRDASLYASMLATAAYTAAIADRRDDALTLVEEAEGALGRGGGGFTPNDLTLYKAGVARMLGDYGHAVSLIGRVRLDLLPTPERRARYWEDAALSWVGRGRPGRAYEALREAERAAPQEVRYRPWAKQLTSRLLAGGACSELPDLRQFATRVGVSM